MPARSEQAFGKQPGSSFFTPQGIGEKSKLFSLDDREIEQVAAADIPPRRRFRSMVLFLMGRKGAGKTLGMTALAKMWKDRMKAQGFIDELWSNYDVEFGDYSQPYLIDEINKDPLRAQNKLILIDEVASAFDSRRPMSSHVIEFYNFLIAIRKLHSHVIFTTQFPQVTDQRVLIQVDLFMRCRSIKYGHAVHFMVYDWWGHYTGDDSRKPWPPQPGKEDWDFGIDKTGLLWGAYDTDEMVPSFYSANRDDVIGAFYKFKEDNPEGMVQNGNAETVESAEPVTGIAALKTALASSHSFAIAAKMEEIQSLMPEVRSMADASELLRALGYRVTYKNKWLAKRVAD